LKHKDDYKFKSLRAENVCFDQLNEESEQ